MELGFFSTLGLILLSIVLGYHLLFWFFSAVIRRREATWYSKEPMVMLRMMVPKEDEDAPSKGPIVMEQIFNTLYGTFKPIGFFRRLFTGEAQPIMSFEIAHIDGQIYFYNYIPKKYKRLIESQLYAQYPELEIEEIDDPIASALEVSKPQDSSKKSSQKEIQKYSAEKTSKGFQSMLPGKICVAEMELQQPLIWPFKTYEFFVDKDDKTQVDSLSSLTSAISKLHHDADQAWFQLVIRPQRPLWQKYSLEAFELMKKGYFNTRWGGLTKWFVRWYPSPWFWHYWLIKIPTMAFIKLFWKGFGLLNPVETVNMLEKKEVGFTYWELPNKKLTKIAFESSVRLGYLSRSGNIFEAHLKVEEMASSFNQFHWAEVNGLQIARIEDSSTRAGLQLYDAMKKRSIIPGMILGVDELATLYHLPMKSLETSNIAWVRAKKLEPPAEIPTPDEFPEVTLLGRTNFRGAHKLFGIKPDDRRRHMYIIGKTGMGKSTVLENMIFDDIQKGRGVAVVDPHGELADKVTAMIPPERVNDAVIFDPSDGNFPVSFNMLEVKNPEHRPLVASGLVGVFKKMYADSWGPRLEYILRNCILALTEAEGSTLLGIPRLLVDPIYREKVVEQVKDPVVKSFWKDEFANMSDKLRTEAVSPIQNKVGQFLSSPIIRNILGQVKSSIDIRFAMDSSKIFIVNLSKGKIGEDNSSLLGSMLITKFQLDAMSRADTEAEDRKDFYLYVDEFQNFATDSFATILSEARKYKLNLVMANQYVEQMEEEVMYAVFGNVGTLITFQVGFDDAEYFSKQFGEVVTPADIISMPKFTAYMRLLVDNMPTKVFSAVMSPPVTVDMNSELRKKVLKLSRERYGTSKNLVEDKIQRWSQQLVSPEMKKALQAKAGGASGAGVRWRYDRNKSEFEELINSAGKKCKLLSREEGEKYGLTDAVNELVYTIPEEHVIIYSRIDNQGNCFNRKESNILIVKYDPKDLKKHETVAEVEKAPGWQLGMNKALGGGFRNPKNKEEMEKVFESTGFTYEVLDRKTFPENGLEKSLNELVYLIKKGSENFIVVSALDPQGGCFTRNPDQMIRVGVNNGKKFEEKKVVKKSIDWNKELEKILKGM